MLVAGCGTVVFSVVLAAFVTVTVESEITDVVVDKERGACVEVLGVVSVVVTDVSACVRLAFLDVLCDPVVEVEILVEMTAEVAAVVELPEWVDIVSPVCEPVGTANLLVESVEVSCSVLLWALVEFVESVCVLVAEVESERTAIVVIDTVVFDDAPVAEEDVVDVPVLEDVTTGVVFVLDVMLVAADVTTDLLVLWVGIDEPTEVVRGGVEVDFGEVGAVNN